MRDTINFGIGFVTGRPNVCKVINSTYERLINQFKDSEKKVNITIRIGISVKMCTKFIISPSSSLIRIITYIVEYGKTKNRIFMRYYN